MKVITIILFHSLLTYYAFADSIPTLILQKYDEPVERIINPQKKVYILTNYGYIYYVDKLKIVSDSSIQIFSDTILLTDVTHRY